MKQKKWPFVYVGLVTAVTYIPILLTVVYSFNESKISSVWGGFSLKWYGELFRDRDLREALVNSLILAGLTCLCAVVIGTMGAVGMHRKKTRLGDAMATASMLPIMIPEIILGMVFLSVFSLMDLPFGMLTLVIAHTAFSIPYVYSMVSTRLVGMDRSLEEAALDLGAPPFRVPGHPSGDPFGGDAGLCHELRRRGHQHLRHRAGGQYTAGENLYKAQDRRHAGDQCPGHRDFGGDSPAAGALRCYRKMEASGGETGRGPLTGNACRETGGSKYYI